MSIQNIAKNSKGWRETFLDSGGFVTKDFDVGCNSFWLLDLVKSLSKYI